jgi:hypothetical protein
MKVDYFSTVFTSRGWDGTVYITSGYGLNDERVGVGATVGARFFSFPDHPD